MLDESDGLSGRFTIGPLTEVAAQHHTWAELSAVLDRGPRAAFVAHERVLRGEAITDDGDLPAVLDLPLELQPWEPAYALATYSVAGAEFPMPDLPGTSPTDWTEIEVHDADRLDDDVELAVRQLVEPWLVSSNGHLDVACVEGDVDAAIGALGVRHAQADAGSTRPRHSPGSRGQEPAAAPTAAGGAAPRDGSVHGGCSPRSAISSTTGPCRPPSSAHWLPNSTGIAGTPTSRRSAGRCSSPSPTQSNGTAWAITARDAV